jgi:hypothetical protein
MDCEDITSNIGYLGWSGNTLSPEQLAAVQVSLAALKKSYDFARTVFWGKIMGTSNDLLVAQGHEKSFTFGTRRAFISYGICFLAVLVLTLMKG